MYKTGFTEEVVTKLKNIGVKDEDLTGLLEEVAKTADVIPQKYEIDSFDGVKVHGIELSFLRNNKEKETTFMTLEESQGLDFLSGTVKYNVFLNLDN